MKKKTFQDLYKEEKEKPTPAQQFIADIAELTHRSTNTVKMWLLGRQIPDELTRSVIADRYGVDSSSLFPTLKS